MYILYLKKNKKFPDQWWSPGRKYKKNRKNDKNMEKKSNISRKVNKKKYGFNIFHATEVSFNHSTTC